MQPRTGSVQNRAPLATTPLTELPLGSIEPMGWLRDQLEIQANGLTGHLGDFWEDVGSDSGWLGGSGESWERGPYYLDGLLPLAYLLKDEALIAKVQPWVEWALSSQREDGQFGPSKGDDWWCRMIMLKVLIQHQEVTGDVRVIPFLTRYFRYQAAIIECRPLSDWGEARGGENILCIQWLYNRTGDRFLLDLVEVIHKQTLPWTAICNEFPFWRYQTQFDHRIHVVNVAMGLKEPALYSLHNEDPAFREAAQNGMLSLMTYHGQVHGMFTGDEWLAGTHPSQGVELCAVVEYMFTLENLVRIVGDGSVGDVLEQVAYNALPAAITADWCGHQYDQQVNQVLCTLGKRNWTCNADDSNLFGLEPNFGCCTANMHQGWPKLAARLWMATSDAGLAAVAYAPCRVQASIADGVPVTLQVDTNYPFREDIAIHLEMEGAARFPLKLRIPGWCTSPSLQVNGERQSVQVVSGYAVVDREWRSGDRVELTLPMEVRIEQRGNNAVGIQRGPLAYALPIEERWQRLRGEEPYADYEVYPGSPWNYALQLEGSNPDEEFRIKTAEMVRQPFAAKDSPVRLVGTGRRVPSWRLVMNSADTPPMSPVTAVEAEEAVELVPYGGARLRIAEFPVVKR